MIAKTLGCHSLLLWLGAITGWSQDKTEHIKRGQAAWYGLEYQGKPMANGKPFDCRQLTCATYEYPLGAWVEVSAWGGTRKVVVQVTDRGPSKEHRKAGRIMDLSYAAFCVLANPAKGVLSVDVRRVNR